MTCMRARKRSKFGAIQPPDCGASCSLASEKNPYILLMEIKVLPLFHGYFGSDILAGNDDMHESSVEW